MFVGNSRRNDLIFPKYFLSFFSAFQFYIWMNLKILLLDLLFKRSVHVPSCKYFIFYLKICQDIYTEIISRISWFKHCWYFLVLIVIYFNLGNLGQFLIDYRGNNISASHLMIELFQNKMAASIAAPLAGNYFYSPFISSERSSPAHSPSSVASSNDRRLQIHSNIITRFNS